MRASRSLARSPWSAPPLIRFLYVGPRLRSTLPSHGRSPFRSCASLRSLWPALGRTHTSKVNIMLGVQARGASNELAPPCSISTFSRSVDCVPGSTHCALTGRPDPYWSSTIFCVATRPPASSLQMYTPETTVLPDLSFPFQTAVCLPAGRVSSTSVLTNLPETS